MGGHNGGSPSFLKKSLQKIWRQDKMTYLWDNKHGEQMNYTITNTKRFAKVQSVDIHRDNILITLKGGGHVESWGEHGANDFAEFGITLHA